MPLVGELAAVLRAENADFKQKFAEAGDATESLDKKLKKFGLGFGGVGALAVAFRAIVDHARDLNGELDENQQRAKRFATDLDGVKKSALDVGVAVLGTVNGLGEWIGRQVAVLKYGKEQVALTEQIAKQTEQTLAAVEKDKKLSEEIGRIRGQIVETEKRTTEEASKQLDIRDRILAAEQKLQAAKDDLARIDGDRLATAKAELEVAKARGELTKLQTEQAKKTAEDEKKAAELAKKKDEERVDLLKRKGELLFEQKSTQEKIYTYEDSIATLTKLITEGKKAGADVTEYEVALLENQKTLAQLRIELTNQQAAAEGKVAQQIGEQNKALEIGFKIRGRMDQDLSEAVLEEKVRTLAQSIAARQRAQFGASGGVGGGGVAYDPLLGFEQAELARAKAELEARRQVSGLVGRYGEQGAQRFYQGSAVEFERLLQTINPDAQAKTLSTLERIEQRLAASGLFPRF